MLSFKPITNENFSAIVKMKRPENEHFVASNAYSLAQAWLYREANDTFPFAIYKDDEPVGFMMLYEELGSRTLGIWRLMFPLEHQNKGYGSWAIGEIIKLAKESGKYDRIELDYVPSNTIAAHVYEKLGFRPTGEIDNGEIVMELRLK
ncbi:MAG: GNAT family N-acetyltransferase [Oscillospiraceae bacterium]|nr:GNAT family N-acetyltransferase [Oscillospiraceae bacterium]